MGAGVEFGVLAGAGDCGVLMSIRVFGALAGAEAGGLTIVKLLGGVEAGAGELTTIGARSMTVGAAALLLL